MSAEIPSHNATHNATDDAIDDAASASGGPAGNPPAAENGGELGPGVSAGLSYEAAREELVEVVRRLEAGGITLEESLALWERGEALSQLCERYLDGARARVDAALQERPRTSDEQPGNGR